MERADKGKSSNDRAKIANNTAKEAISFRRVAAKVIA